MLHRAVRQQAPDPVDAPDSIDEERVARRLHQRFVEAHAAVVQLVGRVRLDAAGQQVVFRRAQPLDRACIESVRRLQQRGGSSSSRSTTGSRADVMPNIAGRSVIR
ncbi:hypothetical protein MAFF301560_36560 (plasmid) [Ralstonia solanacearum]|nr:hypothetical protein MAFF301560_36560 [Ralstonia solanacearum]BEU48308.1 hypothetical protein MAFF211519_36330 [Ralstonia pseudosolanacearum]